MSGGLDSGTALCWAIHEKHWDCHTLCIDYGQRHRIELEASKNVARHMGVRDHRTLKLDLTLFGNSALTDDIDVPKGETPQTGIIPVTYVPARNTIFLALAAAMAESIDARHIVIGANILDYSGYPDCRPEFIASFEKTINLGTRSGQGETGLSIETPLIHLSKSDIIQIGLQYNFNYALTISCYDPDAMGKPCLLCDACQYRRKGFAEAGMPDPALAGLHSC